MRNLFSVIRPVILIGTFIAISAFCPAGSISPRDCVACAEAGKHIGTSQCIRGTVLHIEGGRNGTKLLSFCKEARACPFTVVVFPADLKKMGDVNQLEGRQVEIKGTVQDYDGRAEIILRRSQQLGEGAFLLFPTVPTDYDVERAGHYSAGKMKHAKKAKKKETREEDPMSIEDPGEPQ
jgi:DNA/RNA endonuclease YhcR with UshA esterase domain